MEKITEELLLKLENSTSKKQMLERLNIEYLKLKNKLERNNVSFTIDIHCDIQGGSAFMDTEGHIDYNAYNQINFIRKCLVLNYWDGDCQDENLKQIKTRIRELDNK